jgi:hypothetical protein
MKVRLKILKHSGMLIQDKIVITDASCFITLDKIDGMRLLHSFCNGRMKDFLAK